MVGLGRAGWCNSHYQCSRLSICVNFEKIENNYGPIEIEFGDVEGWVTARGVGDYLVNRRTAEEDRDAGRSECCDVFKIVGEGEFG